MRILPQISFELGAFVLVGVLVALAMHLSPLPASVQFMLLLVYGVTAALWVVGRAQYFLKRGPR